MWKVIEVEVQEGTLYSLAYEYCSVEGKTEQDYCLPTTVDIDSLEDELQEMLAAVKQYKSSNKKENQ